MKSWRLNKGFIQTILFVLCMPCLANEEVLELSQNSQYWAYPGGNYSNWRYSNLGQINNKNAGKLNVAWTFSTGSSSNHAGGPLALPSRDTELHADTLYIHTSFPGSVMAINLDTLKLEWINELQSTNRALCCDYTNHGLSYADGKIFYQHTDSLLALDAASGVIRWQAKTGLPGSERFNTNTPHPIDKYVLTSIAASDGGGGTIAAFRIQDGRIAWKASSIGTDAEILFNENTSSLGRGVGLGSSSYIWQGKQGDQYTNSWNSLAWDPSVNLIYYGSAGPGRDSQNERRWSSTIFARDLNTGIARWVYQMTPDNKRNYHGSSEILLADLNIGGKQVPALIHFDANGFAYTMNRQNGDLLVAEAYLKGVDWASNIDLVSGRPVQNIAIVAKEIGQQEQDRCPASRNNNSGQAAFSPRTKLFYVPSANICSKTETEIEQSSGRQTSKTYYTSAGETMNDGTSHMGELIAWDASMGRQAWVISEKWPVRSGVLTTAGDVVAYATLDGFVKLVDAKTGQSLWQFKVPSGVIGSINTWMYKNKQYIGVLSGYNPEYSENKNFSDVRILELNKSIRSGGSLFVFSLP